VRPGLAPSANARRALARLQPLLIAAEAREEWPGTRRVGHTAIVHCYRFTAAVRAILRGETRRLYAWAQPHLSEDLALLAPDATPWLTTISHERNALPAPLPNRALPAPDGRARPAARA
jgi:hypothetical protein